MTHEFEYIQTSKVTLETIRKQNPQVYMDAVNRHKLGSSYTAPYIGRIPEKKYKARINDWQYNINKYCFRGEDWNFTPSIAIFGCSLIFGTGVEKDCATLLKEKTGRNVINMGIPGASIVHIIKNFASFVNLHPVTDAIISLPHKDRLFFPDADTTIWHSIVPMHNPRKFQSIIGATPEICRTSAILDAIDWANTIASAKNINLFWTTWDDELPLATYTDNYFSWPDLSQDVARDAMHPGPIVIDQFTDNCLRMLNTV